MDVTDPGAPLLVETVPTDGSAPAIEFFGPQLIVAFEDGGISSFDDDAVRWSLVASWYRRRIWPFMGTFPLRASVQRPESP